MQQLFLKLINLSLSAGILILVVLIIRKLFEKAPKWIICLLWGIVAIRLICPFSLESALSLAPRAEMVRMDASETRPVIQSGFEGVDTRINTYVANLYVEDVLPALSETSVEVPTVTKRPVDVVGILSTIWLAGVILLFGYGVFSYARVYKSVRISIRSEKNVYLCDDIKMPFILGVVNPRIYLPSDLTEDEKANILAHEQAHIGRGDFLWKPLGFLLLTVYWFQPLIWVAYIMLCRDIEMACDEKVIANMSAEQKKQYSMVLLSFSAPNKMITACPLAFGEVGVKERVKGVMNYRKPAFWVILAALVVCVAVMICFLTNSKGDEGGKTLPKLTTEQLEALYQQEFDKYSDKLPSEVNFDFITLTYNGQIYTAGRDDKGYFVHPEDVSGDPWEKSLADYPVKKICDVYGEVFIKPVYGNLNADGQYSDVYAWYDDVKKVKGEAKQGTLWEMDGYHPENQVILTIPRLNAVGRPEYEMIFFRHVNDVNIETGKDLLNLISNVQHIDQYGVVGRPETLLNFTGDSPKDKYFIGDFLKAPVISVEEIKNIYSYKNIMLHEKDPYDRNIYLRDYGNDIVGYHTPEGTAVYFKVEKTIPEPQKDSSQTNTVDDYFTDIGEELPITYADLLQDNHDPALASVARVWANAFCERDGYVIGNIVSDDLRKRMLESEILTEENGQYAFGYSSPWPMQENAYVVTKLDSDASAIEILYYAMTSDPTVTVWREIIHVKKEGGAEVIDEELTQFDCIETIEDFEAAYPKINNTWMDYTKNGLAPDLYRTAQLSSSYLLANLQNPVSAAKLLLHLADNENIVDTAYYVPEDDGYRIEQNLAAYDYSEQDEVIVLVALRGSSIYREIKMVKLKEYGDIWVPQDMDTSLSDAIETEVDENLTAPSWNMEEYDTAFYLKAYHADTEEFEIQPVIFVDTGDAAAVKKYGLQNADLSPSYIVVDDDEKTETLSLAKDVTFQVVNWKHQQRVVEKSVRCNKDGYICVLNDAGFFFDYMKEEYGDRLEQYPMMLRLNASGEIAEVYELWLP